MNRTEQKEILKDILERINDLKEELKSKEAEVLKALDKISDLGAYFEEICAEPDTWDEEELKSDLIKSILENSILDEVQSELYDFKSELESYMDELTESRREKLEERYAELESVLEMLDYDESDDSLENMYDRIVEGETLIKEML